MFINVSTSVVYFFSRDNVEPMVVGIRYAVYAEVESLEDGERAVRMAIEKGEIVRFPVPFVL
jgi:hypothetical protein